MTSSWASELPKMEKGGEAPVPLGCRYLLSFNIDMSVPVKLSSRISTNSGFQSSISEGVAKCLYACLSRLCFVASF